MLMHPTCWSGIGQALLGGPLRGTTMSARSVLGVAGLGERRLWIATRKGGRQRQMSLRFPSTLRVGTETR